MSSSNGSTAENSGARSFGFSGKHLGEKGNWSPMNIGAMVVGFVFFWPIGLVLLYWNIKGRDVRDLPGTIKEKWADMRGRKCKSEAAGSDNSLFNEFQQTQYDRIREIKEEIKERARRFQDFRADAKRRADEEEFNQFMANNPDRNSN